MELWPFSTGEVTSIHRYKGGSGIQEEGTKLLECAGRCCIVLALPLTAGKGTSPMSKMSGALLLAAGALESHFGDGPTELVDHREGTAQAARKAIDDLKTQVTRLRRIKIGR